MSIEIDGKRYRKGQRLIKKVPYRIYIPRSRQYFTASLVGVLNKGKVRIAIFSIPK